MSYFSSDKEEREYGKHLDQLDKWKVKIPFKDMDKELLEIWNKIPHGDGRGKEKSIFFDGTKYFGGYYRRYSSPEGRADGKTLEESIKDFYNWIQYIKNR